MTVAGRFVTRDGMVIGRAALRRKYRLEHDKRLRPDGNDQYLRPTGRLGRYLDDPFTSRTERAPRTGHVTVEFIGRGFDLLLSGPGMLLGSPDCTPGYDNNDGQPQGMRARLNVGYPQGPMAYFRYIGQWRASGAFEGLEFR